jgi:hypothetical protein
MPSAPRLGWSGTRGRARRCQLFYALFSNDTRVSKAYPTEADVWKVARTSGLVVDVATEEEKANPHPVLDNHYGIRPAIPSRLKILPGRLYRTEEAEEGDGPPPSSRARPARPRHRIGGVAS